MPVWVVTKKEEIFGTVPATITSKELHRKSMAVHPLYRWNKIGYGLLQQVENFAMVKRINTLYLSTTPFLHEAILQYKNTDLIRLMKNHMNYLELL